MQDQRHVDCHVDRKTKTLQISSSRQSGNFAFFIDSFLDYALVFLPVPLPFSRGINPNPTPKAIVTTVTRLGHGCRQQQFVTLNIDTFRIESRLYRASLQGQDTDHLQIQPPESMYCTIIPAGHPFAPVLCLHSKETC